MTVKRLCHSGRAIPKDMLDLAAHIVDTKTARAAKVINLMDAPRRSVEAERTNGKKQPAASIHQADRSSAVQLIRAESGNMQTWPRPRLSMI
jgi:non-homologous end joining protein Ku